MDFTGNIGLQTIIEVKDTTNSPVKFSIIDGNGKVLEERSSYTAPPIKVSNFFLYKNSEVFNNSYFTIKVVAENKKGESQTIEEKVRRISNNKEPITDGAPIIYTKRAEGIDAAYDIRSDKWEESIMARDKVSTLRQEAREYKGKVIRMEGKGENKESDSTEPTQGTENK